MVVSDNDRESVAAYHAVGRLGAVAVMCTRAFGASDVEFACSASAPTVLLLASKAEPLRGAAGRAGASVYAIGELTDIGGPPAPGCCCRP